MICPEDRLLIPSATPASAVIVFPFPGLVNFDSPSANVFAVKVFNSLFGFTVRFHLNETKSLASSGIFIRNDFHGGYMSINFKEFLQLIFSEIEIQISNINVHNKKFN